MKNVNNIEIQVGDIIIYGYGFYSTPVMGLVTKLYKNSFAFEYRPIGFTGAIWQSVCKKPNYSVVVTEVITPELINIFKFSKELFDQRRLC